jgi:hypothetical protein
MSKHESRLRGRKFARFEDNRATGRVLAIAWRKTGVEVRTPRGRMSGLRLVARERVSAAFTDG